MDKKIQKQWVAALRSGKYNQGQGALLKEYYIPGQMNYCCLGVLCDLAQKAKIGKFVKKSGSRSYFFQAKNSSSTRITDGLPQSVRKWAGISKYYGFVDDGNNLITCNDNLFYDFNKIADIIEKKK